MTTSPVPLLDAILSHGLQAAEEAAASHPQHSRNFRMIMAMLWSARDELDLVRETPPVRSIDLVRSVASTPVA